MRRCAPGVTNAWTRPSRHERLIVFGCTCCRMRATSPTVRRASAPRSTVWRVARRAVPQSDVLHIRLDPAAALAPYARHRHRFALEVADLDRDALATPSRCSKWSVADVLRHINDVDGWMDAIWSGGPPPFTSFDPNVTPNQWVEAGRAVRDAEVRDRFVAATAARASTSRTTPSNASAFPRFPHSAQCRGG